MFKKQKKSQIIESKEKKILKIQSVELLKKKKKKLLEICVDLWIRIGPNSGKWASVFQFQVPSSM